MAEKKNTKNVAEVKPATEDTKTAEAKVTVIPAFRDNDGILLELSKKDFPRSRDGKVAFLDYQIERLSEKKKALTEAVSPKQKAQSKMKKLQAQLAKLQAEIEAAEQA
jgi:hypothetical protein